MATTARATYIETIEPRFAPLVLELDRAIMAARPDLHPGVRYRMLMYAHEADFRHWVCAIDASRSAVRLRFLYGARLVAPPGILRPGSTTMGTIDYASPDDVDADLVADLVRQAVVRLGEVKAQGADR